MTSLAFTLDTALYLSQSTEKFPVDFDVAWEWLGYSQKGHAKTKFMKCSFVESVDFEVSIVRDLRPQGGFSNREVISLTCECLKQWGMMAGTEKGKQIRMYFLECESRLKEIYNSGDYTPKKALPVPTPEERLKMAMEGLQFFGVDITNPRVSQHYQDYIQNLLLGDSLAKTKALPGNADRWLGVAERAEELGFGRVGANAKQRQALGMFFSPMGKNRFELERFKEERLCNDQNRGIWLYKLCPEFDKHIGNFFQATKPKQELDSLNFQPVDEYDQLELDCDYGYN